MKVVQMFELTTKRQKGPDTSLLLASTCTIHLSLQKTLTQSSVTLANFSLMLCSN